MNRRQLIPCLASAVLVLACIIFFPTASRSQSAQPQTAAPPATAQPPAPGDDLAQMRTDLDRMESLLGNMSSEIEFLRDQNLQILLRTNAQIWTILIRDLRRQVDREQQQRGHK
jgi:hypothetical protein